MIKPILTVVALAALTLYAAEAKTVQIPDADEPVASITFPDDWEVEEIDDGHGADSPDDHVYIAAVAVKSEKDMNAQLDDVFEMLKEHKVEFDASSKKENKFKINGLDAEEILYQGKDEDGPCGVSIVFIPVKDHLILLTYWVTTAQEEKHQATVGKILNSLKANK